MSCLLKRGADTGDNMVKINFNEQRPYKLTVCLTDKEDCRLTEFAKRHKMSRQRIIIQALRLYDYIESGDVILTPTTLS